MDTLTEAVTVKAQAKGLLAQANKLLADKSLPSDVKTALTSLRTALRKNWADLEAEAETEKKTEGEGSSEQKPEPPAKTESKESRTPCIAGVPVSEAEFSQNEIANLLRSAISSSPNPGAPVDYVYIADIYPSYFVYDTETKGKAGGYVKRPYVIDDKGKVTLGDAVPVIKKSEWVTVGESLRESEGEEIVGDFTPLLEKGAVRKDGTITIKAITPGWGSSGYYSKPVIERDAPRAFPAGTKMYWNHPSKAEEKDRPERSLSDLAAVTLTPATWIDEGPDGPGAYAEAKVFSDYMTNVTEKAPYIGLSIRGQGVVNVGEAEGKKGKIVERIVAGHSIDFVTQAGRGGAVVLAESATPDKHTTEVTEMAEVKELEEKVAKLQETNTRLLSAMAIRDARDLAASLLAEAKGLPQLAKARLADRLTAPDAVPMTAEGTLDREAFTARLNEAVKTETEYISGLLGSGAISGMGARGATSGTPSLEESAKALEDAFTQLGLTPERAKTAATGR